MNELQQSIISRLEAFPGHTSYFYEDLTTGEQVAYNADEQMTAASVIKLTVMAELFRRIEAGELDPNMRMTVQDCDRVPICGVLTMMHTGMEVTPMDLCNLMITISDNMATNMLIGLLGEENIQKNNERLGLGGVFLERKLFEKRPEFRKKANRICASGIAKLLKMIWKGELVSEKACKEMMRMLIDQQCTNKIPLLLPGEGLAAHKTGEDDNVTHDVGIVLAKRPFLVCFCNWKVESGMEGRLNVLIGEITRELWDAHGGMAED